MEKSSITDKKVTGKKQTVRMIHNRNVKEVLIAKDADIKILDEIIQLCNENNLNVTYVESMKELGKMCDIEVNAAVAAILKK